MTDAQTSAGLSTRPDPPKDRDSPPLSDRMAVMLQIAAILADYGRHLVATIEHRALWRGFATIAQFFGTAALPLFCLTFTAASCARSRWNACCWSVRHAAVTWRLTSRVRAAARHNRPPRRQRNRPPHCNSRSAARAATQAAALPPHQPGGAAHLRKHAQHGGHREGSPPPPDRPDGRRYLPRPRHVTNLCLGPFWTMCSWRSTGIAAASASSIRDMRAREKQLDRENWKHPNLGFPEETKEAPACARIPHRRAAGGSVPSNRRRRSPRWRPPRPGRPDRCTRTPPRLTTGPEHGWPRHPDSCRRIGQRRAVPRCRSTRTSAP